MLNTEILLLHIYPSAGASEFLSVKGQMVNTLNFAGHTVSGAITHFCCVVRKQS